MSQRIGSERTCPVARECRAAPERMDASMGIARQDADRTVSRRSTIFPESVKKNIRVEMSSFNRAKALRVRGVRARACASAAVALATAMFSQAGVAASVPWTPSLTARHAIEVLVDDGGLPLTMSQWPLPREAVQRALDTLPARAAARAGRRARAGAGGVARPAVCRVGADRARAQGCAAGLRRRCDAGQQPATAQWRTRRAASRDAGGRPARPRGRFGQAARNGAARRQCGGGRRFRHPGAGLGAPLLVGSGLAERAAA